MVNVTLYHSPRWRPCKQVEEYLSAKNIEYVSKDITEEDSYRAEMMELGSMGTPTLKIGNEVLIGFRPSKIDATLSNFWKINSSIKFE